MTIRKHEKYVFCGLLSGTTGTLYLCVRYSMIQDGMRFVLTNQCLPVGHPRLYEEWCERFNLEQSKGEISELLVNKPKVRALYTNLVNT